MLLDGLGVKDESPKAPTFSQIKDVTQTIVITRPGVYDFKNVLHIWKGRGSCNQTENQPHILRIQASDVVVKNFAYRNASDGIHIATCGRGQGNTCSGSISRITLENVTGWACEDVLTTGKGTSKIIIRNSFFLGNPNKRYRDKLIQLNFANDVRIYNTIFKDAPRMVRFKSGSNITLKYNRFYTFQQAVRGDTYKDISGIIPNQQATVLGEQNYFYSGSHAYSLLGKINATSIKDTFVFVRRKSETRDGAKASFR